MLATICIARGGAFTVFQFTKRYIRSHPSTGRRPVPGLRLIWAAAISTIAISKARGNRPSNAEGAGSRNAQKGLDGTPPNVRIGDLSRALQNGECVVLSMEIAGANVYSLRVKDQGRTMRVIVFVAAILGCLCGPSRAYDLETKRGQAICDTLAQLEELSIAIGMADDHYIEEMGNKGCHFPQAGLKMALIEAYADQTVLLFRKLADKTNLGPVPPHIDKLTNLAKVRLFFPDRDPVIGFTLLRVSQRPDSQGSLDAAD
jgi:hypothetical protein